MPERTRGQQWRTCGTSTNRRRRANAASRGARRGRRASPSTCTPMSRFRARARSRGPHLDMSTVPLGAFLERRNQGAQWPSRRPTSASASATPTRGFEVMDDMGVDMQLISPGAAADLLHRAARHRGAGRRASLNDGIAEYVGKHPDRLVALGGVPMTDGNEAAKELERCMKAAQVQGRGDPDQCRPARNCPIRRSRRSGRRPRSSARW